MFRNKELFLTGRGKSIMDVEMEKRKFLNLCGKRDRALLSGEKKMKLGKRKHLKILKKFFKWKNNETPYGKNLVIMVKSHLKR